MSVGRFVFQIRSPAKFRSLAHDAIDEIVPGFVYFATQNFMTSHIRKRHRWCIFPSPSARKNRFVVSDTTKVCTRKIDTNKVCVRERCVTEVSARQVGIRKINLCKNGICKFGIKEERSRQISTTHLGFYEPCTVQTRTVQVCVIKGRSRKICPCEKRLRQIRIGYVASPKVAFRQFCAFEIDLGQLSTRKIRRLHVCVVEFCADKVNTISIGFLGEIDSSKRGSLLPTPSNILWRQVRQPLGQAAVLAVEILDGLSLAAVARSWCCKQLPGAGDAFVLTFPKFIKEDTSRENEASEANRFHYDDKRMIAQPLGSSLPRRLCNRRFEKLKLRPCFFGGVFSFGQRFRARRLIDFHVRSAIVQNNEFIKPERARRCNRRASA